MALRLTEGERGESETDLVAVVDGERRDGEADRDRVETDGVAVLLKVQPVRVWLLEAVDTDRDGSEPVSEGDRETERDSLYGDPEKEHVRELGVAELESETDLLPCEREGVADGDWRSPWRWSPCSSWTDR